MAKGKGNAHGYGMGDNVHSGKGSKGAGKNTGTPRVSFVHGDDGRSEDGLRDAPGGTEKTTNAEFATGGDTHMFGEQQAGSRVHGDKGPSTGKPDDRGPGDKFAEGGSGKMFGFNPAKLATAGITSAY